MLDELTVNFVKQRKLKVADRANLAAIKKEMNFQLSGEVGDDSIQQIGAMAGAQTVIRGNMKPLGDTYLLVIHALNVTTAAVEDIYRERIDVTEIMQLLLGGSNRRGTKQSGSKAKIPQRSDRYHGGELAAIGFENILFGTGSYLTGYYVDGGVLTGWHIVNLSLMIGGGATMGDGGYIPFSIGFVSGAGALIYGFVRPKFYTKRPRNGGMSTLDVLSGFDLAFVPLENGNLAPSLSYSISF